MQGVQVSYVDTHTNFAYTYADELNYMCTRCHVSYAYTHATVRHTHTNFALYTHIHTSLACLPMDFVLQRIMDSLPHTLVQNAPPTSTTTLRLMSHLLPHGLQNITPWLSSRRRFQMHARSFRFLGWATAHSGQTQCITNTWACILISVDLSFTCWFL